MVAVAGQGIDSVFPAPVGMNRLIHPLNEIVNFFAHHASGANSERLLPNNQVVTANGNTKIRYTQLPQFLSLPLLRAIGPRRF